jgi:hypothetical protein
MPPLSSQSGNQTPPGHSSGSSRRHRPYQGSGHRCGCASELLANLRQRLALPIVQYQRFALGVRQLLSCDGRRVVYLWLLGLGHFFPASNTWMNDLCLAPLPTLVTLELVPCAKR